jgi:hypothetical protein
MAEPQGAPPGDKSTKAIRLTFSFQGDQVQLVSQEPVEMVLPPSDPVNGVGEQKGFWYELRDAQGHPLYRRIMHSPIRQDVEVFSNNPEQTVARHKVANRKGFFVAVVPAYDSGVAVTLSSSPIKAELSHQPAKEIARFMLKKQ